MRRPHPPAHLQLSTLRRSCAASKRRSARCSTWAATTCPCLCTGACQRSTGQVRAGRSRPAIQCLVILVCGVWMARSRRRVCACASAPCAAASPPSRTLTQHRLSSRAHAPGLLFKCRYPTAAQRARLWLWHSAYGRISRAARERFSRKARLVPASRWPTLPESDPKAAARFKQVIAEIAAKHPGQRVRVGRLSGRAAGGCGHGGASPSCSLPMLLRVPQHNRDLPQFFAAACVQCGPRARRCLWCPTA